MSEILSINELKKMAAPIVNIPNFDNTGVIKVRLQKPRIMAMAAQGKLPNPLMEAAMKTVDKKDDKAKEGSSDIKDLNSTAEMLELFCMACMVEPTYEEMKDIITDDQMSYILGWALGKLGSLEPFRKNEEDGTGNNSSGQVQEKT